MLFIFFVEPCTPTLLISSVQARICFAISLRSVNSIACGSKAAALIFYFFEVLNRIKMA
jgi:hypothetical protein